MTTMIETIFAKGVFRPLKPVGLAENQRVKIHLEESVPSADSGLAFPRHTPSPYPDETQEASDSTFEYRSVPLKSAGTIQARFVHLGPLTPPVYPEE